MHMLRYVSTDVCGRIRNSASTLVYKLEISFKYVTNRLQYSGLSCNTAKGSKNVCTCLYVRHKK